jgi:mannose-6-phosphate isomerase-like protein (cupin superfamily)
MPFPTFRFDDPPFAATSVSPVTSAIDAERARLSRATAGDIPPMRISLDAAFAAITEHWSPVVVAELNGQQVKAVKFKGEFHWHQHANEDEMFLVHRGRFRMEFRDRIVELAAGEFLVVPRGTDHRPVAEDEVEVVLFEPATTVRTGD